MLFFIGSLAGRVDRRHKTMLFTANGNIFPEFSLSASEVVLKEERPDIVVQMCRNDESKHEL